MEKMSVEQVRKILRDYPSAEPEGDKIVYYLHTDQTFFTASRNLNDYFGVANDAEFAKRYGMDWGGACAAVEDDPNSDFGSICEELAEMVNRAIETGEA